MLGDLPHIYTTKLSHIWIDLHCEMKWLLHVPTLYGLHMILLPKPDGMPHQHQCGIIHNLIFVWVVGSETIFLCIYIMKYTWMITYLNNRLFRWRLEVTSFLGLLQELFVTLLLHNVPKPSRALLLMEPREELGLAVVLLDLTGTRQHGLVLPFHTLN